MKDFPDSVILKDKARLIANNFRKLATDATKSWQELEEMADDLGEIPNPPEITKEWLEQTIKTKEDAIQANAALPSETKKTLIKQWQDKHRAASRWVNLIVALFEAVPSTNVKICEFGSGLYVADADGLANELCTAEVPQVAHEHYDRIMSVKDAIEQLRAWERENEVAKNRLEVLFAHAKDVSFFASLWAKGGYDRQQLSSEDKRKQEIFWESFL